MTTTRKTTMNINRALENPDTLYGNQTHDRTRKVASVRYTKTGRPVVTFDDGFVARYTGTEDVIVVVTAGAQASAGKPTTTAPARFRRTW